MAITIEQLAVHLRVSADPRAPVAEPHLTVLTQLHRWANGVVDSRAPGAPETARDEAIILLAGYQFDKPPASRSTAYANAWENSGAANILRPWTKRRGIVLDVEPGTELDGDGTVIVWGGGTKI